MRSMRTFAVVVGLFGAALSSAALASEARAVETFELAGPPVDFVLVESVSGYAQYRVDEADAWKAIAAGDALPLGVMVRTGLRSGVVGVLPDGTRLQVSALTRCALDERSLQEMRSHVRSTLVIDYGDLDTRMLVKGTSLGVVVPQPTLGVQPMLVPPGRGGRDGRFSLPMSGGGNPRR
jgi:hypothetical protein